MGGVISDNPGMVCGVTIGIPVYNEQNRIEQAIRSAAGQCERLIVSDNASTDGTEQICHRLMREFPNMEYYRNEINLGSFENVKRLFALPNSQYFMILGSHDYLGPGFVKRLKEVLDKDPQTVLSVGGLFYNYECFHPGYPLEDAGFNNWIGGEESDPQARVRRFLFDDANLPWAMYGLFRLSGCIDLFRQPLPVNGFDLVFLARIAGRGKIVISRDAQYFAWIRDETDSRSKYIKRLVGDADIGGVQRSLRNATRMGIFDVLNESEKPSNQLEKILLRYEVMARFGVFRYAGFDTAFFILYLPAKLRIAVRRLLRSIRRL